MRRFSIVGILSVFILVIFSSVLSPFVSAAATPINSDTDDSYFQFSNVPGPSSTPGPGLGATGPTGSLIVLGCTDKPGSDSCTPTDKLEPTVFNYNGQSGGVASFSGLTSNDDKSATIYVNVCTSPTQGTVEEDGSASEAITLGGYQAAENTATSTNGASYPTCNTGATPTNQTITVTANINDIPTADSDGTIGPIVFDITPSGQSPTDLESNTATIGASTINLGDGSSATVSDGATLTATSASLPPGDYTVCAPGLTGDPCNPTPITAASFTTPITVTLSGTPTQDTLNTVVLPSSSGSSANTCESTGGPLSWFTCAVINGITSLEGSLEDVVQSMLQTPPIDLNPADCQSGTASQNYSACIYNVWSGFRDFGDIVLVIVLLAVIIAEAAGGGVLEAYSVRRILPRLLLTAILINLSIYIMAGLVDVTNILGNGIFSLLTVPFKETGTYTINITAASGNLFGGLSIAGLFAAGSSFWLLHAVGGISDAISMMVLFVVLPVVLAIIGVILTIFFRSVLIVVLLMVSPVAFALYCLPNTEKYFRKWWDLFIKTLMVYPIVMIVFAMCSLGAVIVSSFSGPGSKLGVGGSDQWLGELMSIVAVAAPLFLIPFAFKMSGGAIGSVHAAITNLGQKTNEAIKGNPNDPNSMRNRTKRRFNTRRAAAGLSGAAIGTRLNPMQVTRKGRENARASMSAHRQAGLEQLRKQEEETGIFRASQGDSNIMRELAWYSSGGEARAAANSDRTTALAAATTPAERAEAERQFANRNAAIAVAEHRIGYNPATRRAAFLNQYQVGFEMEEGEQGWNHAMAIADSISGGDDFQFRSLMDEYQAVAKGPAGRVDQAGNTDGNRTYNGNKAWNNGGPYEIGMGKPRAIQGGASYYSGVLQRIQTNTLDARDQDFIDEAAERHMDPRQVASEAVGAFYTDVTQISKSAKGGTRDAAMTARRRIQDVMQKNSFIRGMVTPIPTPPAPAVPGAPPPPSPTSPAILADVLAQTSAVRLRARAYEPPERTAQQGGP